LAAALSVSGGALAEPDVAAHESRAQQVLAQVQQIDAQLGHAVEAYNLATIKLDRIEREVETNRRHLVLAKNNLGRARTRLADRLVELYTNGEEASALGVLLGAEDLGDLLDRIDTANRVSEQDGRILDEVVAHRKEVERRARELARARAKQRDVVAARAAERRSIEGQLAERRRLLSSIRAEIARIRAAEQARQAALARQARQAAAVQQQEQQQQQRAAPSVVGASATSTEGTTVAPPSRYGGVVGIAMQFLGTPYRWGGASPSGFDCSGFIMYVFAQIGVSLPHNAAAQYGYGTPVSRDQLQPGDLVFFNGLGHAGIYVGGGSFIHSPHTGDVVKISSMSGWYASTFVGGRRL
jgi:cell wall-associated NlpC family hydrolase